MPGQDFSGLRRRFLASFRTALRLECQAVRQRYGPAEVPVVALTELVPGGQGREWVYRADLAARTDQLLPDMECRLRAAGTAEVTVTLLTVDGLAVSFRCATALEAAAADVRLIVYPWFLYERLQEALDALAAVDAASLRPAFTAFGCCAPELRVQRLVLRHDGLNRSQGIALGNCMKSSCAFVWGPPGTGKTTTLARVLLELLEHGHRILVTSNTNAAVDQVLRALGRTPEGGRWLASGRTVRVGSPDAEWEGLTPWRLAEQQAAQVLARRSRLRDRRRRAQARRDACVELAGLVAAGHGPQQIGLFDGRPHVPVLPHRLVEAALSPALAVRFEALFPADQAALLARRLRRLEGVVNAVDKGLLGLHARLDDLQAETVRAARLVTATGAAVSINRLLHQETFDTVVIEEAAMVVLPMLFLCAARASRKVVVVGDPMQLPAIVQSTDPYVQRAMARNIFTVATRDPFDSPLVSMLEEQYRMHPAIGDIVSRVFYRGRLRHALQAADLQHIVMAEPARGSAVVLVDTSGHTACVAADPPPSRLNEGSARIVVGLVRQALACELGSIAVISPYKAQARTIRTLLREDGISPERVECRTVHRFQGNERDMVIVDTVDTDPFPPGVLLAGGRPGASAANLLNVAISRARGKLVVVADREYYERTCPRSPVARVVSECAHAGAVLRPG